MIILMKQTFSICIYSAESKWDLNSGWNKIFHLKKTIPMEKFQFWWNISCKKAKTKPIIQRFDPMSALQEGEG